MGNKKSAARLATFLLNELNSDVASFTTHIKPVLQQIRLLTGLSVGGKTRNIAVQLVLQQCCQTSCTFFVAHFSVPLVLQILTLFQTKRLSFSTLVFRPGLLNQYPFPDLARKQKLCYHYLD